MQWASGASVLVNRRSSNSSLEHTTRVQDVGLLNRQPCTQASVYTVSVYTVGVFLGLYDCTPAPTSGVDTSTERNSLSAVPGVGSVLQLLSLAGETTQHLHFADLLRLRRHLTCPYSQAGAIETDHHRLNGVAPHVSVTVELSPSATLATPLSRYRPDKLCE
jgi:hypothetical protein